MDVRACRAWNDRRLRNEKDPVCHGGRRCACRRHAAAAADFGARGYNRAPAYAPTWTGFYLGAHLGGAFGAATTSTALR